MWLKNGIDFFHTRFGQILVRYEHVFDELLIAHALKYNSPFVFHAPFQTSKDHHRRCSQRVETTKMAAVHIAHQLLHVLLYRILGVSKEVDSTDFGIPLVTLFL